MIKKISLTATFLAATLLTTSCAATAQAVKTATQPDAPIVETTPETAPEIDGESILRQFLASKGRAAPVIDAQVQLAYSACEVLDEYGAAKGIELVTLMILNGDSAVEAAATEAVGAGIVALCPEHEWILDELGA